LNLKINEKNILHSVNSDIDVVHTKDEETKQPKVQKKKEKHNQKEYDSLQHTATHCNKVQHTLQHTATPLQHATVQHVPKSEVMRDAKKTVHKKRREQREILKKERKLTIWRRRVFRISRSHF